MDYINKCQKVPASRRFWVAGEKGFAPPLDMDDAVLVGNGRKGGLYSGNGWAMFIRSYWPYNIPVPF